MLSQQRQNLASATQSHIASSVSSAADIQYLPTEYKYSQIHIMNHEEKRITRTQPIMQLGDPRLPGVLDRRVQEDNLILYPNFVYDRLQGHAPFQELSGGQYAYITKNVCFTFSSFGRLSPRRLFVMSLRARGSRRSSSARSNSEHHT